MCPTSRTVVVDEGISDKLLNQEKPASMKYEGRHLSTSNYMKQRSRSNITVELGKKILEKETGYCDR